MATMATGKVSPATFAGRHSRIATTLCTDFRSLAVPTTLLQIKYFIIQG